MPETEGFTILRKVDYFSEAQFQQKISVLLETTLRPYVSATIIASLVMIFHDGSEKIIRLGLIVG